jgi:hypothetical protein
MISANGKHFMYNTSHALKKAIVISRRVVLEMHPCLSPQ